MTYTRLDADRQIDLLIAKYPSCFYAVPEQRKPLKKDILKDLAADKTLKNPELVERAVLWYQSHIGYHYAITRREPRIDLNGKVVAQITPAEVDAAFL